MISWLWLVGAFIAGTWFGIILAALMAANGRDKNE